MLAANAAKVVELSAPAIDLNFGCPAKTVNRHRGGSVSTWMNQKQYTNWLKLFVMLSCTYSRFSKMRLGYLDENHTLDNAHAIEDAGANWLYRTCVLKQMAIPHPPTGKKIQPITEALKSMSLPMVKSGIMQMPKHA